MPPQADRTHQLELPADLNTKVAEVVKDKQECGLLAQLFTLYACEGAQEIYQSLFSLLVVDSIDEMIIRLDADVVIDCSSSNFALSLMILNMKH